jgi:hypothetical protein
MFTKDDEGQILARGSRLSEVIQQIENFRSGFPYLPLVEAAEAGNGILCIPETDIDKYVDVFLSRCSEGVSMAKFVPASGAASRMFKSLFSALDELSSGKNQADVLAGNNDVREFYERINEFAFAEELVRTVRAGNDEVDLLNILECLLTSRGLNYGNLPKGLLLFHRYQDSPRTPVEEHLVEGASYAKDSTGKVRLHFTVSPEHRSGFEGLLEQVVPKYENEYKVTFEIGFSEQKPSTDTIAVDMNNEPFRESDGSLLFRPAGHGALLDNLNDIDADLIFIKNIDNVVPDKFKSATFTYKKLIAGVLLHYQKHIFEYQKQFNDKHHTALESGFLAEAANFLENTLNTKPSENQYYTEKEELYYYLKEKFNRPVRVCGMVKNEGEPGGGPFWARNSDGTVSLQIAESVQIDFSDPAQESIARHATHFNPVDLVCGVKNYKGEKYDLMKFRDSATGFISKKSKDGRDLKAQELPGLWNGAMSDWNTIFVEVPVDTFNPVKTVNDLLRERHQ